MTTPPLVPPFGSQPPAPQQQQQVQAARDVNTASLCRIGQETVQDIVIRTMEIFQLLRNMQVGIRPLHLVPHAAPLKISTFSNGSNILLHNSKEKLVSADAVFFFESLNLKDGEMLGELFQLKHSD